MSTAVITVMNKFPFTIGPGQLDPNNLIYRVTGAGRSATYLLRIKNSAGEDVIQPLSEESNSSTAQVAFDLKTAKYTTELLAGDYTIVTVATLVTGSAESEPFEQKVQLTDASISIILQAQIAKLIAEANKKPAPAASPAVGLTDKDVEAKITKAVTIALAEQAKLCGLGQVVEDEIEEEKTPARKEKSKKAKSVLFFIIGFLLLAGLAWWFMHSGHTAKNSIVPTGGGYGSNTEVLKDPSGAVTVVSTVSNGNYSPITTKNGGDIQMGASVHITHLPPPGSERVRTEVVFVKTNSAPGCDTTFKVEEEAQLAQPAIPAGAPIGSFSKRFCLPCSKGEWCQFHPQRRTIIFDCWGNKQIINH